MDQQNFLNTKFFDIGSFSHKDILAENTPWQSISLLSSYITELFSKKKRVSNFRDKSNVFVGEGTMIHPSVEIEGIAIIGSNCHIGQGAFLRDACIVGDNVHIGHAVEIKHSILLNNSIVAHFNYIGDSVVGNGVNISAGAITANFRLDKQNIIIKSSDGKIDTKLQKFGAAIGDNSMIGVNSVLNPGTILGKNTLVYPLKSISGVHTDNAVLK